MILLPFLFGACLKTTPGMHFPGGCPPKSFVKDGWQGGYPEPVLQVDTPTTVDGRAALCDTLENRRCTLTKGLYHPWRKKSGRFKTILGLTRFKVLEPHRYNRKKIQLNPGDIVVEEEFLNNGKCNIRIGQDRIQGVDCPGNRGNAKTFRLIEAEAFPPQQFVEVECVEGHRSWINVNADLLEHPNIRTGHILEKGRVGRRK